MAQGREFHGVAAKDAGLVDGLTTYDALVAALQESVDKQHPI
jgi:ClpP class serine protease